MCCVCVCVSMRVRVCVSQSRTHQKESHSCRLSKQRLIPYVTYTHNAHSTIPRHRTHTHTHRTHTRTTHRTLYRRYKVRFNTLQNYWQYL